MSALAGDRAARLLLGATFAAAALLVLVALWSVSGDAPAHWARARWTVGPLALCAVCIALALRGAWRRRQAAALWVPLVGAALTALAAVAATLSGRL